MNAPFATTDDIIVLWRKLNSEEEMRAKALLPLISDAIRQYGVDAGVDVDAKAEDGTYASVLKIVTVDVVTRVLRESIDGEPMTQESQSGLGYSWSGSYAIPGGGISGAIMYNDLKRLGLLTQTAGVVELWGGSKVQQ